MTSQNDRRKLLENVVGLLVTIAGIVLVIYLLLKAVLLESLWYGVSCGVLFLLLLDKIHTVNKFGFKYRRMFFTEMLIATHEWLVDVHKYFYPPESYNLSNRDDYFIHVSEIQIKIEEDEEKVHDDELCPICHRTKQVLYLVEFKKDGRIFRMTPEEYKEKFENNVSLS